MVGCSAIGCINRAEQGYVMRYFPKDAVRRKLWAAQVKYTNWTPTDRFVLCEVSTIFQKLDILYRIVCSNIDVTLRNALHLQCARRTVWTEKEN